MSSCGAIAEMAVEEVAEEATGIEVDRDGETITFEGGDGSIMIDGDAESVTIESDEGTMEMTTDGEDGVTIEAQGIDSDGNETEVVMTSDNELPEGLDVPVPDGGTVVQSTSFSGADGDLYQVLVTYQYSDYDRVASFYSDYFDGTEGVSRIEASGPEGGGVSFTSEDVVLSISQDGETVTVYLQTIPG